MSRKSAAPRQIPAIATMHGLFPPWPLPSAPPSLLSFPTHATHESSAENRGKIRGLGSCRDVCTRTSKHHVYDWLQQLCARCRGL